MRLVDQWNSLLPPGRMMLRVIDRVAGLEQRDLRPTD